MHRKFNIINSLFFPNKINFAKKIKTTKYSRFKFFRNLNHEDIQKVLPASQFRPLQTSHRLFSSPNEILLKIIVKPPTASSRDRVRLSVFKLLKNFNNSIFHSVTALVSPKPESLTINSGKLSILYINRQKFIK